jgi:predicted transcriptional regulator
MHDTSHYMAATGSRRVVRALMEEEEEIMEIDSPQGSAQKRLNGKVKDSTEKHNKKKSKGVETTIGKMLEKLDSKLWLRFSYMEQLAAEEGLPKCMTDGPIEDLVATGYK